MNRFSRLMFSTACTVLVIAGLTGCADFDMRHGARPVAAAPAVAAPDVVTLRLAEAAEKAAGALDNISRIEQVSKGTPPADDYTQAPPELREPTTITWTGPAPQFLRTMANRAGYTFRSIGAAPPVPLTVTIDEYQQPLVKLIKSAALQITGRADVVLDANRRLIELRYAPVDRN